MDTRPAGSVLGNIRFIEEPGVQDEGDRHMDKRSCDPGHPSPKLDFRY